MSRGHVLQGTPVAVNYWKPGLDPHVELFFLTSYERELLDGLNGSWNKPIYTSHVTAELLKVKMPYLSPMVRPLDFGTTHVLPLDYNDYCIAVTLFYANHCPGSVLLRFEGTFGIVLYTGNFRFYPELLPQLDLHQHPIDHLYFDNTYCSPSCNFPTTDDVLKEILDHIKQKIGQVRMYIGTDSLGKEEVLIKIFEETNRIVTVSALRMETLDALELDYFADTDEHAENGVFLISNSEVNGKIVKKWSSEMPTEIVLLTAKYFGSKVKPFRKYKNVRVFPYSGHSSFHELVTFVREIKPMKISPLIEEPLKGMYDVTQGSVESLALLISSVNEQSSANENYSPGICVPNFLVELEETFDVPVSFPNVNCKPSEPVCRYDQHIFCKRQQPATCSGSFSSRRTNTDPCENNRLKKPSLNTRNGALDFPVNLNDHFMKRGTCRNSQDGRLNVKRIKELSRESSVYNCEVDAEVSNSEVVRIPPRFPRYSPANTETQFQNSDPVPESKFTSKCNSSNAAKENCSSSLNAFEEIPLLWLSLVCLRQQRELRRLKINNPGFSDDDEKAFLMDSTSIVYTPRGGTRQTYSVTNGQLFTQIDI